MKIHTDHIHKINIAVSSIVLVLTALLAILPVNPLFKYYAPITYFLGFKAVGYPSSAGGGERFITEFLSIFLNLIFIAVVIASLYTLFSQNKFTKIAKISIAFSLSLLFIVLLYWPNRI